MWGQVSQLSKFTPSEGIIPTRVGTRFDDLSDKMSAEDHPHACGDKQYANKYTAKKGGSSPRVWGQVPRP